MSIISCSTEFIGPEGPYDVISCLTFIGHQCPVSVVIQLYLWTLDQLYSLMEPTSSSSLPTAPRTDGRLGWTDRRPDGRTGGRDKRTGGQHVLGAYILIDTCRIQWTPKSPHMHAFKWYESLPTAQHKILTSKSWRTWDLMFLKWCPSESARDIWFCCPMERERGAERQRHRDREV